MSDRTPISNAVEAHVLMASARRCALCFGLSGDLSQKRGQIAHIDQNAANAEAKNLVYLCINHHDEYDSTTSQTKGITEAELRGYKDRLLIAILSGDHHRQTIAPLSSAAQVEAFRDHDERLFRRADELLPESSLRELLDDLQSDDSYHASQTQKLRVFRSTLVETGNQFIEANLCGKTRAFIASLDALLLFLARHFFIYPGGQEPTDDLRLCMHPDLNIDRNGSGTSESMARYDQLQLELDNAAGAVRSAYDDYRMAVKLYLCL